MPKAIIESMKRGGVDNPYALLNAAGYHEGDSEQTVKAKLSAFQRAHRAAKMTRGMHRRGKK
jgi:hypothetical protein